VPTNTITINLSVESVDQGPAVVRANLNDGHALGGSYRLDGGDSLRACIGGKCRAMADNESLFAPDYIARFDFQAGVDYVVSFNRKAAADAPDSRVKLPPAFSIVTPAGRQQVTDGETVVFSWMPTGAPARVSLSYVANCKYASGAEGVSTSTLSTDSNGDGSESVSIDPIVTVARSGSPASITRCSIDVTVSHELQGRIDPAFDDGLAVGIVSRVVNLDYIPR
jgi:hypothetical protein